MKKFISILLVVMMVVALAVVGVNAEAPEGTAVKTAEEFAAMTADGKYYLDADITLAATYANDFTGTFDGNGHTVTITTGAMFTKVNNATIKNLTVNGTITTEDAGYVVGNEDFAAAVALVANGTTTFKNITSNVNFTTTSANTRYGALFGTAEEGYDLLVDSCVNNGAINVAKYAAGLCGWSAKLGNSVIKNCVNTGAITSTGGYVGGIINRLSNKGSDIRVIIKNCVNTGAITGNYGGGIIAYSNSFVSIQRCVNFADITAVSGGSTGGIAGNLDQVGTEGGHTIKYNTNYGNISNTAEKNTGGIVGYVYGSGSYGATVEANVNYGTVSSAKYCSQILAYTNSNLTKVVNNVAAGKVVGGNDNTAVIVGLSSADITQYTISGNYYVENDGTKMYSYADSDDNAKNRKALTEMPEGAVIFVSADKFTNGDVANALNTALGEQQFEVRDGKTVLKCDHSYLKIVDQAGKAPTCVAAGTAPTLKCAACNAAAGGGEELPATGVHAYADGKCTVCDAADPNYVAPTEPVQTEPEPQPTEPAGTTPQTQAPDTTPAEEEGCGSAIAGVLAIVAVLGTAVAIKRK